MNLIVTAQQFETFSEISELSADELGKVAGDQKSQMIRAPAEFR